MHKLTSVFVVAAMLLWISPALADITVDMSGSQFEIHSSDTIRIRNMTAPGSSDYPGKWWVDFRWDPHLLMLVPIDVGQEAAPAGKTWSWIVTEFSDAFVYTLTSDPVNRTFHVSYKQSSGTPFICAEEDFIQGNNSFRLVPVYIGQPGTALITYTTGFSGCGHLYAGQTIEGEITHLPAWFDFSKTFAVGFGAAPMYCEPDGSHHK